MSVVSLVNDYTTLILNGSPIADLSEGDYLVIEPVNPHSWRTNSTRGGVTIGKHVGADVRNVRVIVQKYSPSDVLLNGWLNSDSIVVIDGSAKESYQRDGELFTESYTMESGSMTDQPTNTKNNVDGSETIEYVIQFRTAKRAL